MAQVAVWLVSAIGFLLALGRISEIPAGLIAPPGPWPLLAAACYFLLGYALFGTLMGALGAVTTTQRESGQVTAVIVLPAMVPFWTLAQLLEHPDGALAQALSYFPLTAPLTAMVRLGIGGMDLLQVLTSLAVMALFVALVVVGTLRLFRTYLLTTGSRPGARALVRTVLRGEPQSHGHAPRER